MAHQLKIFVCAGLTGSGKTTWLADRAVYLLRDNKRSAEKYDVPLRPICSNIHFSKEIEEQYGVGEIGEPNVGIWYWKDPEQLVELRQCDVLIDELATYFDSTQYALTPLSLKRWLQQHRKFGICIYGTVQDFPMLDIAMRRLVHKLRYARKWFGTRDLAANMPDPKRPWGLCALRSVKRESMIKDVSEYQFDDLFIIPEFLFYTKRTVSVFDTREEILAGSYPPLRKIVRVCPEDGYKRIQYV